MYRPCCHSSEDILPVYILQCAPSDKISCLRARISEKAGIRPELQRILAGFPPTELKGSDTTSLAELGLANGELLRVSELSERAKEPAPIAAAALGAGKTWQCAQCTLINEDGGDECAACGGARETWAATSVVATTVHSINHSLPTTATFTTPSLPDPHAATTRAKHSLEETANSRDAPSFGGGATSSAPVFGTAAASLGSGGGAGEAGEGKRVGSTGFQRKVIDADNSCLFNAVAFCLEVQRALSSCFSQSELLLLIYYDEI
jgi:ubiquitin thioesterase OTU1